MRKIFHLSTCNTCQRIIQTVDPDQKIEQQDIKSENIDAPTLDLLKTKEGSYEALFSKRAMKFRAMGLHEQKLTESDYRDLILKEYTFLKRPVIIWDDAVFVGNSAKVVEAARLKLKDA